MARFPTIDRPCPLSRAEQRAIDGHCTRCNCAVQSLDGLDDATRLATVRAAKGPICVSYRLAAGFGAALALSMAGAAAADPNGTSQTPFLSDTAETPELPGDESVLDRVIMVGGVSNPDDATWIDDSDLPELPMRPASTDTD